MENHNTILHLLESSFLFCGLNSQQLQDLASKTRLHTYQQHQVLIEEGLINNKIIILVHGLVKIYKTNEDGKEIFLGVEKKGDYLGVMDLDERPASATIEALQPTKILIFHKKDLVHMLQDNPALWERMYQIVLAKLREFNRLQSILMGNDLYNRTHLLLLFLSQFSENRTVLLSQETLATIVGATRPRVTETLQILQKDKKITVSPKKITVL